MNGDNSPLANPACPPSAASFESQFIVKSWVLQRWEEDLKMQRPWFCRFSFVLTYKKGKGVFKSLSVNAMQLGIYYVSYWYDSTNTKFFWPDFQFTKNNPVDPLDLP